MSEWIIIGLVVLICGVILRALAPEATLKTIGYVLAIIGAIVLIIGLIFYLVGAALFILPFP